MENDYSLNCKHIWHRGLMCHIIFVVSDYGWCVTLCSWPQYNTMRLSIMQDAHFRQTSPPYPAPSAFVNWSGSRLPQHHTPSLLCATMDFRTSVMRMFPEGLHSCQPAEMLTGNTTLRSTLHRLTWALVPTLHLPASAATPVARTATGLCLRMMRTTVSVSTSSK